jgi:hypothetical protein
MVRRPVVEGRASAEAPLVPEPEAEPAGPTTNVYVTINFVCNTTTVYPAGLEPALPSAAPTGTEVPLQAPVLPSGSTVAARRNYASRASASSGTPPAGGTSGGASTASTTSSAADVRFYVVWYCPSATGFHGLVFGQFPAVWQSILAHLPLQRYAGSGIRLRRADTFEEGLRLYASESARWTHLPVDPVLRPV